jgi:hypothetical protein
MASIVGDFFWTEWATRTPTRQSASDESGRSCQREKPDFHRCPLPSSDRSVWQVDWIRRGFEDQSAPARVGARWNGFNESELTAADQNGDVQRCKQMPRVTESRAENRKQNREENRVQLGFLVFRSRPAGRRQTSWRKRRSQRLPSLA